MITISLAQIDIAFGDRDANLAQANGLVQEAAAHHLSHPRSHHPHERTPSPSFRRSR